MKAVSLSWDFSVRSSHQYRKMRLAQGCFHNHYHMYDMMVSNGQWFPCAKLQDNDIVIFNISTCTKEVDIYCTCTNILQINREKRTYWIKEHLHKDLKTYYHYQCFMGRYQACAFKEWNPKGNFILPLLVHFSLCLITFVCRALLIIIITVTV